MSDKPKRRWNQFSLRTLFLVTTLLCVIAAVAPLPVRSLYYRNRAAFHWSQRPIYYKSSLSLDEWAELQVYHVNAAKAYEAAAKRPWLTPMIPPMPSKRPPEIPQTWIDLENIANSAPAPNPPKNSN